MEGKKHVDLWVDGSLYPKDPSIGRSTPLFFVYELIYFLGDAMNGLLGYCIKLIHSSINKMHTIVMLSSNSQTHISGLEKIIKSLEDSNLS